MKDREVQANIQEVDIPAIEVRDVVKLYKLYDRPKDRLKEALGFGRKQVHKAHYALKGVTMCINRGETVGIIGTNGSGKSTILKIITGVLNPTSGEVKVDGRISALLELGAGFNMEYNGIENVYLNGTMMGFSEKEIDEKLPDILEFADIGDYVYQPVKTYSSGMFVRLAFAVAINIEPEILIVDEALSVGDVFFQAKCYHKFEDFKRLGKTIVFVSHDLSSISKYCDRVFLLNKGILLGEGSPKQMIDAYKRVLVGQYELPEEQEDGLLHDGELRSAAGRAMGKVPGGAGQEGEAGQKKADIPAPGQAGETTAGEKEAGEENPREGLGEKWENAGADSNGSVAAQSRKAEGINPDALEYGTMQARMEACYVTDDRGVQTTAILKGSEFTVHMRVRFHDHIPAPIFAFSVKNVIGTEITGTNSMIEKAFLEGCESGQVMDVTFTQRMTLQGGEYLLSLGVTGYNGDTFEVYHRLYDVIHITVVSDKNTVGYYDMESVVEVKAVP